jgi:hypothetical protein
MKSLLPNWDMAEESLFLWYQYIVLWKLIKCYKSQNYTYVHMSYIYFVTFKVYKFMVFNFIVYICVNVDVAHETNEWRTIHGKYQYCINSNKMHASWGMK